MDLNIPGNWKSTEKIQEDNIGVGLQVGGMVGFQFLSGWLIEPSIHVGYDQFKLFSRSYEGLNPKLNRWSVNAAFNGGFLFDITDEMKIGPIGGIALSYYYSTHTNIRDYDSNIPNFKWWNSFNLSWGIGSEIEFDRYGVSIIGYFGTKNMIKNNIFDIPMPCYPNQVRISMKYYI